MSDTFRAMALCALGLEKVLSNEIGRIGLEAKGRAPGRVFFDADATGLFRANLELRTAERVLLEAARFRAPDFDALFEGSRSPEWARFFARDDKLVIERVRSRDSQLSAQTSIQSIVHKAIYENLCRKYKIERMPETGRERSLRVYLEDDECVLGLDLSGEALHKRGWRRASGEAPLKETIAAGIILLAGWRRRLPLLDPLCGTGTLLIEAAHFALDRAPGLDRSFDIESMPLARDGGKSGFVAERERARDAVRKDAEVLIVGRDTDPRVIDAARSNAEHAGVAPLLDLEVGKAEDARPMSEVGILLTNPPWGERMGTEAEAEALYGRLGEAWGASSLAAERPFAGWGLGFVTNRADFGEFFGRRAPVEREIVNGSEEQWFHWFPEGWENRPERARDFGARDRGSKGYVPREKKTRPGVKAPSKVKGSAPSTSGGPKEQSRYEGGGERPPRSGSYSARPRDPRSRDPKSRDQSSREQGPRDYAPRGQDGRRGMEKNPNSGGWSSRDHSSRGSSEGRSYRPRVDGAREVGSRDHDTRDYRARGEGSASPAPPRGSRRENWQSGQRGGPGAATNQRDRDQRRGPPPGAKARSDRETTRDKGEGQRGYGPPRGGQGPQPPRPADRGGPREHRDEDRRPAERGNGDRGKRGESRGGEGPKGEGRPDPRKNWPGHN